MPAIARTRLDGELHVQYDRLPDILTYDSKGSSQFETTKCIELMLMSCKQLGVYSEGKSGLDDKCSKPCYLRLPTQTCIPYLTICSWAIEGDMHELLPTIHIDV